MALQPTRHQKYGLRKVYHRMGKIPAIKAARSRLKCDLKEAKELIEEICKGIAPAPLMLTEYPPALTGITQTPLTLEERIEKLEQRVKDLEKKVLKE